MKHSHSSRMPLAVAAILLPALAAAQSAPALAEFLARNRATLDLSDGGARFNAGLLDLKDKQIVLLGESHGIAASEELDLALLQFLHNTAGVRVYLAEEPYSAASLINRFLDNGDEHLLDGIMREFEGSIAWTKETRDFYVSLRRWNLTLPEKERVHIAGIDVEHQRATAIHYLAELAKPDGQPAPPAIAETVAQLRLMEQERSDPALDKFAGELASSLAAHRTEYAALLGSRLFDFELVVGNLRKAVEYYAAHDSPQSYDLREHAIYDTFQKVYARMGGGRWYGRWGSFHILQRRTGNRDRFAAMLNQPGSPVAGKVASILSVYSNSEQLAMPGYHKQIVAYSEAPVQPFVCAAQGPITLFKLTGDGSPFGHPVAGFLSADAAPAASVQYVVLIQDATAAHQFEEPVKPSVQSPVVVRTSPESGSKDVSPALSEVRATFSKEMQDKKWAWCRAPNVESPPLSDVHYDADRRTIVAKARLEPGRSYAVWLNNEGCIGFLDTEGHPAVPYLLVFQTAPAK